MALRPRALVALALVLAAHALFADAQDGQSMVGRVRSFEKELGQDRGRAIRREQQQPRKRRPWYHSEAALTSVLTAAEESYQSNMHRRGKFLRLQEYETEGDVAHLYGIPIDGLFIPTYCCAHELRLGAWLDGGKWVCAAHYTRKNRDPVVLSVGSNGDTSFEKFIYDTYGVRTSTVDFSLTRETAKKVSSLDFVKLYEVGLYGTDRFYISTKMARPVKWVNIIQLLDLVGEKYVDIFKIDCEGCEYGVIQDLKEKFNRRTAPFGQILVELHLPSVHIATIKAMQALEGLGYRLFHAEINRFDEVYQHAHYELAYIHESIVVPRSDGTE